MTRILTALLGNVGKGKTFAACCIANALIKKGCSAWVVTAGDLIRAAGKEKYGGLTGVPQGLR